MAAKSNTKPAEAAPERMGRLPLPLVATLAAAAPFRMVFKRLPKESPIDGARRAARVAAVHRQREMLKDEHCLI